MIGVKMKYDVKALDEIPIMDVLESLGSIRDKNKKVVHCFNIAAHKNNDKNASLAIYEKSNSCFCFACGVAGKPVNIVKTMFNGDFKQSCEYLHSTFNIPFLNGAEATIKKVFDKAKPKEKQYVFFDKNKEYIAVEKLNTFMDSYSQMSKAQKLKMIYTAIYRFSLQTDSKAKNTFYLQRGIKNLDLVEKIGFLSYANIKEIESLLKNNFPISDLIEFKIFHKDKQTWNYAFNVAFVPCFDLYSNLVVGFSLRAIDSTYKGVKEVNVSCSDIIFTTPFGLENEAFKKCERIIITEGHIDCLSAREFFTQDEKVLFISFGGVFNCKEEMLTLFKDKKVLLCFDKDEAGLNGEKVMSEKLSLLRIANNRIIWDVLDGKDLNDLLKANKMHSIRLSA